MIHGVEPARPPLSTYSVTAGQVAVVITGENLDLLPAELVVPLRAYNGNTSVNRDYNNVYILHLAERTATRLVFVYPYNYDYPEVIRPGGHTFEGIYSPNDPLREIVLPIP